MSDDLTGALCTLIVFLTLSWFLFLIFRNILRTRALQAQASLQNKVIDKLASSEDVLAYVNSDVGKSFGSMSMDVARNPLDRILETGRTGIVGLCLGIGCSALYWIAQSLTGRDVFLVLGLLLVAFGIGCLLAAAFSYFLSRSWGLLDRNSTQ